MFEYLNRGSADGDNIYEADFRSSHRVDAPLDTDVESDGQARSSKEHCPLLLQTDDEFSEAEREEDEKPEEDGCDFVAVFLKSPVPYTADVSGQFVMSCLETLKYVRTITS